MKTKIRKIQGGVPSGGSTGQVLVKQSNTDNDVAWESALGSGGGGGTKLAIDTTETSANSTTPVTAYSIPIPGGILGTNNAIRFKLILRYLYTGGAPDGNITIKYGGQDLVTNYVIGSSASQYVEFDGVIIANGATNAQKTQIMPFVNSDSTIHVLNTSLTVDSTVSQNLEVITKLASAGSGSSVDTKAIIIEKITDTGVVSGSNTIQMVAGNTFEGSIIPWSFVPYVGQELIVKADSTTFSSTFGDVDAKSKYCFQLNVIEGQSVNIDLIKIIQITGVGTNTDDLKLSIQGNVGGVPDGIELHTSTIPGFTGTFTKDFNFTPFELYAPQGGGDKNYFVVLERTGALSLSNYYNISLQNTGGTNSSPKVYNSSTLTWANDNRTICNGIYFTYLDGVAYASSRGISGTKSANGDSGSVPSGSRIFCYDVSSSGGGWYTDSVFAKVNGTAIGRSRGFVVQDAVPGDTITCIIAGIVNGFTGLTGGLSYSLPSASYPQNLLQFAASSNDVGVGQAITSTSLIIHRESA